jgi:hypothetical protein
MIKRRTLLTIVLLWAVTVCTAENIDPYNDGAQFGYSENTGWLNAEPSQGPGVHVYQNHVEGMIWAENIGWINLSPSTYGQVSNFNGRLDGYAWAENVGWINFDPYVPGETRANEYCVRIDDNGYLDGWAWGENIGWIHFDKNQSWSARVCVVGLDDLHNFAAYWLTANPAGNLDHTGTVNFSDYSVFASWWQDYCPDNWNLK